MVIGSWGPDLVTKWFVYGTNVFGFHFKANDPPKFHRGWPGAGFTHSLTFGAAVALLIYLTTKSRGWALGFMIGHWAHCLSDVGDTVGTILFFPWTHHFTVGAWVYTVQTGRLHDAAAYYSGLGWVWDLFWLVAAALCWRVITREYFLTRVAPKDPFWAWAGRRLPEAALLALYRGAFFYGACRFAGWMIWTHVVHHYPFDPTWGGPHWAHAGRPGS